MKSNPFQFLNAINQSKEDLIRDNPDLEKEYKPYFINRSLSYHIDAIFEANEMNAHSDLDAILQNDFYLNSLRGRKRFAKWIKAPKSEDLDAVMEYFGFNRRKAEQALKLLSKDDLSTIYNKINKGGFNNGKRINSGESGRDSAEGS